MSTLSNRFGHVTGLVSGDVRFNLGMPGAKNALALVASYHRSTFGTFDDTTFYGRLLILKNSYGDPLDVTILTTFVDELVFDVTLHTPGPHSFFFPLADLQGSAASALDSPITVILSRAQTANPAELFVPKLTVSGQVKGV